MGGFLAFLRRRRRTREKKTQGGGVFREVALGRRQSAVDVVVVEVRRDVFGDPPPRPAPLEPARRRHGFLRVLGAHHRRVDPPAVVVVLRPAADHKVEVAVRRLARAQRVLEHPAVRRHVRRHQGDQPASRRVLRRGHRDDALDVAVGFFVGFFVGGPLLGPGVPAGVGLFLLFEGLAELLGFSFGGEDEGRRAAGGRRAFKAALLRPQQSRQVRRGLEAEGPLGGRRGETSSGRRLIFERLAPGHLDADAVDGLVVHASLGLLGVFAADLRQRTAFGFSKEALEGRNERERKRRKGLCDETTYEGDEALVAVAAAFVL
mmetsp:Transcript_30741/g.99090  ORF Transcript_30741/g.99090 Transcript_30741/m.99090 type:complete len:319 (+) Transcript_30741:913-1869(+)